jgi:hypothetical protein
MQVKDRTLLTGAIAEIPIMYAQLADSHGK